MDGKLKKKQSDATFQMKVLLYKNKKILEEHRKDLVEARVLEASKRTRKLLNLSASLNTDDDISTDMDLMLDSFYEEAQSKKD